MSEFHKEKSEYLQFDAVSLKQHIKDRLNESKVFTDQLYEGSNISTIIDIVAYTFNVLMFYLNKTSSESMFSDAQIYENMNRIVKLIDYKPIGNQTSTLSFNARVLGSGETESSGLYTIPRYSYFELGGVSYSINEDITFSKTLDGEDEDLIDMSNEKLLYQGKYKEYPIYNAVGQENEIIFMSPGKNVIIDHFNIDVYVQPNPLDGGKWEQWHSTPSLYLNNANDKVYEIRFNENKNYEIKFGNNINGKKLDSGSRIAIYYLKSDGEDGEVGVGALDGQDMIKFLTSQYTEIMDDVIDDKYTFLNNLETLEFTNDNVSTFSSKEEDVDAIRDRAPGFFRSQYRLVTSGDYENFIKANFSNLISDVKVVNNWEYVSGQLKYYYDLGLTNPNQASRPLYNQVMFSDACNFNNIYVTAVPKVVSTIQQSDAMLSASLKTMIKNSMENEKTLTSEVVITDPVYVSIGLGISTTDGNFDPEESDNTILQIVKDPDSRRDNSSIKLDVEKIFLDYFDRKNVTLGQVIDIKQITADILAVNGVRNFYTQRIDEPSIVSERLSMVVWHPIYTNDSISLFGNYTLPYFKFPYLHNASNFSDHIKIITETRIFENIEF